MFRDTPEQKLAAEAAARRQPSLLLSLPRRGWGPRHPGFLAVMFSGSSIPLLEYPSVRVGLPGPFFPDFPDFLLERACKWRPPRPLCAYVALSVAQAGKRKQAALRERQLDERRRAQLEQEREQEEERVRLEREARERAEARPVP